MLVIIFYIFGTLAYARYISGYDCRYNDIKYFVLKNKKIAKFLLPKKAYFHKVGRERHKSDFNKMTYIGALFYICNLLLILSIPIFLFLIPEIEIEPSRYSYIISFDSLNEKIIVRGTEILFAIETLFYFVNLIVQMIKRKQFDKK